MIRRTCCIVVNGYTVFIETEYLSQTTLSEVNMSTTTNVKESVNKAAKDFLNGLIYKVDVIRNQVEGRMLKDGKAV